MLKRIYGERIAEARQYRAFDINDLSKLSGISIKRIRQIENEDVQPTLEEMCTIAWCLKFPNSYFMQKPRDDIKVGATYFCKMPNWT